MHQKLLAVFENYKIRRHDDEETETWYSSIIKEEKAIAESGLKDVIRM